MKPYSEYRLASTSMADERGMAPALADHIRRTGITHVVESGTYLGTGSTRMLADAFPPGRPPVSFVTIEANWHLWRRAGANLAAYPFVSRLWGRSVRRREALRFIRTDEALLHHERWPDVFIDDPNRPVAFYSREVWGRLGAMPSGIREIAAFCRDRVTRFAGEDLLARSLRAARDHAPLVLLDSAGGIGWLEFQTVLRVMGDAPFTLVLDDTHHLKHFRSLAHIKQDPAFRIIAENPEHGWVMATRGVPERK